VFCAVPPLRPASPFRWLAIELLSSGLLEAPHVWTHRRVPFADRYFKKGDPPGAWELVTASPDRNHS